MAPRHDGKDEQEVVARLQEREAAAGQGVREAGHVHAGGGGVEARDAAVSRQQLETLVPGRVEVQRMGG